MNHSMWCTYIYIYRYIAMLYIRRYPYMLAMQCYRPEPVPHNWLTGRWNGWISLMCGTEHKWLTYWCVAACDVYNSKRFCTIEEHHLCTYTMCTNTQYLIFEWGVSGTLALFCCCCFCVQMHYVSVALQNPWQRQVFAYSATCSD